MYHTIDLEDFFHIPFKAVNAGVQGGAAGMHAFSTPLENVAKEFGANLTKMMQKPPIPMPPGMAGSGGGGPTFDVRTLFFPKLSTPYALEHFFNVPASGGEIIGEPVVTSDGGAVQTTIY